MAATLKKTNTRERVDVKLKAPLTINSQSHKAGDTVAVKPRQVVWLKEQGVIEGGNQS